MPWRVVLSVLCSTLLMAWWNVGACAEPISLGLAAPAAEPALPAAGGPAIEPSVVAPGKPDAAPPAVGFPYRASITADTGAVRSGPGEEYYETSGLRRGDEVEVYRHDPHGWCAIRPPQGSFSYVPAEHLKLLDDDMAETTVAGVKSFAGSSVGEKRDRSHVSLRRGERVVLLEKKPVEGLCKIAPPAGEFRWVHEKCLERIGPVADAGSSAAGSPSRQGGAVASPPPDKWRAAPRTTAFHEPDDAGANEGGERSTGQNGATAGSDGAARRFASDNRQSAADKPRRPMPPQRGWVRPSSATRETDESPVADAAFSPAPQPAGSSPQSEVSPATVSAGDDRLLSEALDQMDLALSSMVCQAKNQWNLDPLRDAAKEVLRNADRPTEQGRARRLLDRIAQFETVRRQALGLPQPVIEDHPASVLATAAPPRPAAGQRTDGEVAVRPAALAKSSDVGADVGATAPPPAASSAASSLLPPNWEDPRFDGSGRLVPLEKRGDSDPQFLLVDDQGVARYFVTPGPGVNLRSYRDRIVGITGSRTDDSEGGKPHLTALRVMLLPAATPRR